MDSLNHVKLAGGHATMVVWGSRQFWISTLYIHAALVLQENQCMQISYHDGEHFNSVRWSAGDGESTWQDEGDRLFVFDSTAHAFKVTYDSNETSFMYTHICIG